MESGFTIGQLAKKVGVGIETVRYYERLHLLSPSTRKPSGYRVYGSTELCRLHFIKNAQALGFTLHEIAEFLNLRVTSTALCGDVKRKTRAKLAQVEKKIQDLQALARSLQKLIRSCEAELITDHCPILQSLEDQAGWTNKDVGQRKP
ncbi:MAG: heavy metal-responsive transcriptional regulator [Nitrospiraceae bacterium]